MNRFLYISSFMLIFVIGSFIIADYSYDSESIVVSTSMLESVTCEVIPPSRGLKVVRLLPSSACPGHFDLSPQVVPLLRSAVMMFRHDYQDMLEKKMVNIGAGNISSLKISTTGTPLIPLNYYELAEQIGNNLSKRYPGNSEEIYEAQKKVKHKTDYLAKTLKKRAETWENTPIIAAVHVKEFCEWLGFEVVGIIKRPEDTSPQDLEQLMMVNADMIVANLQEGMKSAVSLGEKLHIPVAVLSNYPGAKGYGDTYYDLIDENLRRLEKVWRKL